MQNFVVEVNTNQDTIVRGSLSIGDKVTLLQEPGSVLVTNGKSSLLTETVSVGYRDNFIET